MKKITNLLCLPRGVLHFLLPGLKPQVSLKASCPFMTSDLTGLREKVVLLSKVFTAMVLVLGCSSSAWGQPTASSTEPPPQFFSVLLNHYGKQIALLGIFIIILLLLVIMLLYNTSLKIKMQNDRFIQLENLTEEYIFEYSFQEDRLHLSKRCLELFQSMASLKKMKLMPIECDIIIREQPPEVSAFLKDLVLSPLNIEEKNIHFSDGTSAFFRVVKSTNRSKNNAPLFIIGKLVNISKDREEKEMLLEIARLDMMTQLLNSQCCKADICEAFWNLKEKETGFLYLMDIDNFKKINDTYGHAAGDQIITAVAKALGQCFGHNDILGRVGGDEFCAYTASVHSKEEALGKYDTLLSILGASGTLTEQYGITISMGIVPIRPGQTFESAYRLADEALYEVKRNGKGKCHFMSQEEQKVRAEIYNK